MGHMLHLLYILGPYLQNGRHRGAQGVVFKAETIGPSAPGLQGII